jgi:farnesyl-diphosphate farnesyltransferase
MDPNSCDEAYQEQILQHVSRTFALTIPQLPPALRISVTNAYLLCRIADTIEDQTASSAAARLGLLHRFVAVLCGGEEAAQLARDVLPRLYEHTLPAERELILNMGRIVRLSATLPAAQRAAIERCVRMMCDGMHQFQCIASRDGLARLVDLDDYCYYVAGVVGEMLTQLFCAHAPEIEHQRAGLERFCVSFAQGLQMTNILKDVWEDRERGACWLPQEIFSRHGVELRTLQAGRESPGFDAGMRELVGIAHAHLRNALSFTLLIPRAEVGIRRFCLWAIGMAVLTLRKIVHTPGFTGGAQVKISHTAVGLTQLLSNAAVRHNGLLQRLFDASAAGLPLATLGSWGPAARRTASDARAASAAEPAVSHAPQHDWRRQGSSGR